MTKPLPRPFVATRHIGQQPREQVASLALNPASLRRETPLTDLAAHSEAAPAASPIAPAPLALSAGGPPKIDTAEQLALVSVGHTVLVNTQLVAENPSNARVFYRSAEVDQTGQSIAKNQQDVPASGWIENGHVYLVDGGKRLRGVRSVSVPYIKVAVEAKPESELDAWMKSRRMNDQRSTHTVYDDAVRFHDMLTTGQVSSQAELIERIREKSQREMTPGYVSQIVSIASIPRAVMMRLVEVPALCSKNAGYEISRLFVEKGLETLAALHGIEPAEEARAEAEKIVEEIILAANRNPEMSSSDVRDMVKRGLGELTRRPRAHTVSTPLQFVGFKGKVTAVPKHGQLRLELNNVPEDRIDEIQATLLRALEGAGSA